MASRMKKMFHRKKDEEPDHRRAGGRDHRSNDPGVRTSLYDSTTAAQLPQTGDYPIRGNDSSVILQAGRKSSIRSMRSRRSSSRGSQTQYDSARRNPRMSPPPQSSTQQRAYDSHPDQYQHSADHMVAQDDGRKRWSRSPLPDQFAGLSIDDRHGQSPISKWMHRLMVC